MATIKELNVKPGDIVDCKDDANFSSGPYVIVSRVKDGLYKDRGWIVNDGDGILEDTDDGFYIVRRKASSSFSDRELLESHAQWLRGDHEQCNPFLAEIIENLIDERDAAVIRIRSLSSALDNIQEECLLYKSVNRHWMDF